MSEYRLHQVSFACLNCGYDFQQSIAGLTAAMKFNCKGCGYANKLDTKQTRQVLQQVLENGGDELRQAMRRFVDR